jgi:hypothetical protein
MAPFSIPNPFRSSHCMNYEQQTPTSSPESQNLCSQQRGRSPFSGLLRKPRSVRATLQATAPVMSSTCLCGPQVPLAEELVYPMTFPTPASLTLTDDNSTNDRIPTSGLRRRSSSHTDLRTVAQRQPKFKAPRAHIPLLPSPLQIDEPSSTSTTYFYFQNPRLRAGEAKPIEDNYMSYEDLRILSCYCENSRHCDDFESFEDIKSEAGIDRTNHHDESSLLPDQSTMCSIESDWLADTRSYDERLRRCCQKRYQHPSSVTIREDTEHEIVSRYYGISKQS